MHIDLNAFFAEAEFLRHPELRGKPLAVGGTGRRGVVSTASYEARRYGVGSGMPGYQARAKCPGLVFLPVDFSYYEMLSVSFFNYLKRYSPLVEPASIDEGYVDMTKPAVSSGDPIGLFREIQKGLLLEIGLKCSIGVSSNRFLAKMASDMKKPMGLTVLRRRDIPSLLWPLPVSSFYGIGKRSFPELERRGYKTIGELAQGLKRRDPFLVSHFGKTFDTYLSHAFGLGSDVVSVVPPEAKSIGRSLTLEEDSDSYEVIEDVIRRLSLDIGSTMKSERKEGMTVTVSVKDVSFKTKSKSATLEGPIGDGREIYSEAMSLYTRYFSGMPVRLIGVSVSGLREANATDVQMNFFNYGEYEKKDRTKLMVQEWNRRLEGNVLKLASEVKGPGNADKRGD